MRKNKMNLHRHAALAIGTILISLVSTGCNGPDPAATEVARRNATNIQKIANAFILFAEVKGTGTPKSMEELTEFVTGYDKIKRNLAMMEIDPSKFAEYSVSELDNEEFTVRWGARYDPEGAAIPLVFEKTGVDGIRRVALSDSRILSVDNSEKYKSLLAGKISVGDAGTVVRSEDGEGDAQ